MIKDKNFLLSIKEVKNDVWNAFAKETQKFLDHKKVHNYIQLVNYLLEKLYELHINMRIKFSFNLVIWKFLQKILVLSAMNRVRGSTRRLK